jgi:hypothetical protein
MESAKPDLCKGLGNYLSCSGTRYSLIDGASFWQVVQVAADETWVMLDPRESFTFQHHADATTLVVGALPGGDVRRKD